MRIELLPSTVSGNRVTKRQHYSCFVIDGKVAVDAGSLANSTSDEHKKSIRSVVLSHAHLDHIAGLPLYIDDLFDSLTCPVEIFATQEVIEVLENDIFNWRVYPKFSELENESGPVMCYRKIEAGVPFKVEDLTFEAIPVNHKVPSVGFVISSSASVIAITGDTAEMNGFWQKINGLERLDALLIECAFPNRMSGLAEVSHHLTPEKLGRELGKLKRADCSIFAINLKPMYREETEREIRALEAAGLQVLEVGYEYSF